MNERLNDGPEENQYRPKGGNRTKDSKTTREMMLNNSHAAPKIIDCIA